MTVHLSPCGRGRIASLDAIRVRGLAPRNKLLVAFVDATPHPALRATFSHKGRRNAACVLVDFDHNELDQLGTSAITRSGLPEPPLILSGAAMTTAPVGGNWSRLIRLVMPNLPAPCIVPWLGKGGSKVPACPASVPMVSTPTPSTSRWCARNSEQAFAKPGEWEPSSRALMNSLRVVRALQPVRSSTHAPAGMRPWLASQDWTRSGVSRKS